MNSEKVKEIKKALEQNDDNGIMYEVNDQKRTCKFIHHKDILTLINELESENERLKQLREVDYKTMTTLRQANTELNECMDEMQDRIAELEKENEKLKKQIIAIDTLDETNFEKRHNAIVFITKEQLKQFAERLMNYDEFLLHADEQGRLFYVDFTAWLDETLKECLCEK